MDMCSHRVKPLSPCPATPSPSPSTLSPSPVDRCPEARDHSPQEHGGPQDQTEQPSGRTAAGDRSPRPRRTHHTQLTRAQKAVDMPTTCMHAYTYAMFRCSHNTSTVLWWGCCDLLHTTIYRYIYRIRVPVVGCPLNNLNILCCHRLSCWRLLTHRSLLLGTSLS